MGDAVRAILTRKQVILIIFAAHTTHTFQTLNVVLFGALTKQATGLSTLEEEQLAAAFIIKISHDFKQKTKEINIWRAFSSIGLIHS
jgi:hypothetical protein